MPGGGEDHVARGEAAGVKVENDLLVEAGDGLHRSEDRAAKRMALPEVLGEGLVDEVVGVVLVHLDLFEDDSLLAGDVFGGESGVEDQVGQKIKCWCNILIQNLDIEADALFSGESVEVAADGVDLSRELVGRARSGALEDHMLDKVGYAIEGEPESIQTPIETERTWGMLSVRTSRPLGRRVRRMLRAGDVVALAARVADMRLLETFIVSQPIGCWRGPRRTSGG